MYPFSNRPLESYDYSMYGNIVPQDRRCKQLATGAIAEMRIEEIKKGKMLTSSTNEMIQGQTKKCPELFKGIVKFIRKHPVN